MPIITPPVDVTLSAYLKDTARWIAGVSSDIAGQWGDRAIDTSLTSAYAGDADAQAEAGRQLQFLGGPLVQDEHKVPGLRHDLIGKRVRLKTYAAHSLGYDGAGALAFVIGAVESEDSDTTTLTVLRRLA